MTKEDEKFTNYAPMVKKINRKINSMSTKIVQVVVDCLGVVSGRLESFFERSLDS